jgi:hypothetical protein
MLRPDVHPAFPLFPIVPNREEESWKELFEEGLDRFLAGQFAGAYETRKFAELDASLPASPPWKEVAVSP